MLNRFIATFVGTLLLCLSTLTSADKLQLTIESSKGEEKGVVVIGLLSEKAPGHAARIKQLTNDGSYDGVVFHRVINGFMAQTGDVEYGNQKNFSERRVGTGGSTYEDLKAELSDTPFTPGVVGMARSRYINSANSQFFIMTEAHDSLNGSYTVIGFVIKGMDVVRRIKSGSKAENGKVNNPDVIKKAEIIE